MQEGEFELPPNIYKNLNDKSSLFYLGTKRSVSQPATTSRSSSKRMQIGST